MKLDLEATNEVTKKIKNLRYTYNQELLKIEKSKKSGCGTDDIYKPSIKWLDAMDYIMKIINLKEKQTTSNLIQKPYHASTSGNELSEELQKLITGALILVAIATTPFKYNQ